MKREVRTLLLAVCGLMFACLLISGSQRLIASPHGQAIPAVRRVQAFLCSPASYESGPHGPGWLWRQRGATRQEEAVRFVRQLIAALAGGRSDANGNVLTSGVSYWRAVYQAFALGDGFA